MIATHMTKLAELYCKRTGLSEARVATLAYNQGGFFDRLRAGAGFTNKTYLRVLQWFSDHWPEDVPWPDHIERPSPTPREAAE